MIDFDASDEENYNEEEINSDSQESDDANKIEFPDVAPPSNKNDEVNTIYLEQSEDESNIGSENEEENNDESESKGVKEEILKQRNKVDFQVTDTDAIRMVETFKSIGSSTFELASLADITAKEVRKVIEVGEKKSEDIQEITDLYYENKNELLTVLIKFKEYFDGENNILSRIADLENAIQHNYGKFSTSIDIMAEMHTNTIEKGLHDLVKKIDLITKGVNVDSIIKNINTNVNGKFKSVKLDALENTLKRFEKLNNDLIVAAEILNGDKNGKKGLFYALSDQLEKTDGFLKDLKNKFNYIGMISAFFVGAVLSGGGMFAYLSTHNIFEANLDNAIKVSKTLDDLKNKYKGYDGFTKKYGLDGNKKAGFGYFKNNGHPYFSYDKNMKVYNMHGKYFVDLGE